MVQEVCKNWPSCQILPWCRKVQKRSAGRTPSHQASSANYFAAGRLGMFRFGSSPQSRIESLDNLPDEVLQAEMTTPGSRVFHSTCLVDLQRIADQGVGYSCFQYGEEHSATWTPTTVIVSESEQVATYQSPVNCTLTEVNQPSLPKACPNGHWPL